MWRRRGATSEPNAFRPRGWRVLLGFVCAPFLAVLLLMLGFDLHDEAGKTPVEIVASALNEAMPVAFVFAYPTAVVFGLPLFFVLNGRVGYGPLPPILVGYAIVAVALTLFQAVLHPLGLDSFVFSAGFALAGALGGFIFWLIAVWRDPRRTRA